MSSNNHTKKTSRRQVAKNAMILSCVSFILFILLIILVKAVDVAAVGPAGTKIGLSHLNAGFAALTGVNTGFYKITEVMGVFLLLVVGFFGIMGLMQLIQRKSLLKVDRQLLTLGGLYVILGILYVFFEKVVINYRPVLMDGETSPEASFPSSHTMLVCVVMGSAILLIDRYIRNENVAKIVKIVCCLVIAITVIGRLVCGVHWFTDILGGVLISLTLLGIFKLALMIRK